MQPRFEMTERPELIQSLSTVLRRPHELEHTDSIRVAAYNVYNLLDDSGRRPKPKEEMRAIGEMIRHMNADVIAFAEVQDEAMLKTLFDTYVNSKLEGSAKYDGFVCLTGNDQSGINVALVTRLSIRGVLTFQDRQFDASTSKRAMKFSRDLLGVAIQMTPDKAHTYLHFAAHLKSKIGGEAADRKRRMEAEEIVEILTEDTFGGPMMDRNFLLTGDMNDDPDGHAVGVFRSAGLTDSLPLTDANRTYPTLINASPTGRRKYQETRLDYLFASASIASRLSDVTVHRTPDAADRASDHYPISARLAVS
jgi:endonuclease/exonuclease/phosphatase family metal-dependent hydrolase